MLDLSCFVLRHGDYRYMKLSCCYLNCFAETKGIIGIKDVTSVGDGVFKTHDLGIIASTSDITYNEADKTITVKPVPSQKTPTAASVPSTSHYVATDMTDGSQIEKIKEFVGATIETAVDRQNEILAGLADMVKDSFSYLKERDDLFKEKQVADNTLERVIENQNAIIEKHNARLEKQDECLYKMCEVLKQVTVTHDMIADSE